MPSLIAHSYLSHIRATFFENQLFYTCRNKNLFYICRTHSYFVEMKLSNSEEELMNIIWRQKRAFMKELLEAYPEPKPAPTTVATLLTRMMDKGFVAYKSFGRSRQYYPLVKKQDYFSKQLKGLIKNFFNDSPSQFASFFTRETDLNKAELEELKKLIEQEIKRK